MDKTTHSFQAEVKQLLHLVTHSLYSNKEIFLRELISNASDACDKLRFEALDNSGLYEDAPNLAVRILIDKAARTLTIRDNGIGMSAQEAIDHLGTIAKSGTKEFMGRLSGDQKKDAQLIGQFGVGFYSGYIVADKITVETRRAGLKAEEGVRWTSEGTGDFEVEAITKPTRGTDIILHLREGEDDFLARWKLRSIIGKYSDHISLPILMQKEEWNQEKGEHELKDEWETVNQAAALWTRSKSDITEEQYHEFYKQISHDHEAPLAHTQHPGQPARVQCIDLVWGGAQQQGGDQHRGCQDDGRQPQAWHPLVQPAGAIKQQQGQRQPAQGLRLNPGRGQIQQGDIVAGTHRWPSRAAAGRRDSPSSQRLTRSTTQPTPPITNKVPSTTATASLNPSQPNSS